MEKRTLNEMIKSKKHFFQKKDLAKQFTSR